ncbi:hypothetical protein KIL84_005959 [Mauremys mutica]|uniref:Uncharacterized protein n=1 Tax=Mauremys mutica TaxID=74926 RepID=A0A9D4B483_9SAUR|nr:hypothetical protein KIL84_005959 [Mauremys mutica]
MCLFYIYKTRKAAATGAPPFTLSPLALAAPGEEPAEQKGAQTLSPGGQRQSQGCVGAPQGAWAWPPAAGQGWGGGSLGWEELWALPSPLPRLVSTQGETVRGWAETRPLSAASSQCPPWAGGCGPWSRGANGPLRSCYRPEQSRGAKAT